MSRLAEFRLVCAAVRMCPDAATNCTDPNDDLCQLWSTSGCRGGPSVENQCQEQQDKRYRLAGTFCKLCVDVQSNVSNSSGATGARTKVFYRAASSSSPPECVSCSDWELLKDESTLTFIALVAVALLLVCAVACARRYLFRNASTRLVEQMGRLWEVFSLPAKVQRADRTVLRASMPSF